jgi:hypothetical protein
MGKASKGTERDRRRTVRLTSHAYEMVRDRLTLSGVRDHASESDASIGHRIDQAVIAARRDGTSRRFTQERNGVMEELEVVPASDHLWDADVWPVLLRDAVVTVLTGAQVNRSLGGKWKAA